MINYLKKIDKKKAVIITLIVLTVIRILIGMNIPALILQDQSFDDALMHKYALSIREGHWLGSYNLLTLTKGISFSVFMAVLNFLSIPYNLGLTALYAFACFCMAKAFKPKFSFYSLSVLYILLLFSPGMFNIFISQRMYRNAILPAGTLLVYAGFIGLFLRKEKPMKENLFFILLSTFSLVFFWHIKEDSIWILPFTLTINFLMIIYWLVNDKKKILVKTLIIFIPFISLFAFNRVYSFVNYKVYGINVVSDKSDGNFARMIKDMLLIKDTKTKNKDVWISTNTINNIYKVSPTFKKLKPIFDSFDGWLEDDGEAKGDLVIWRIRAVMDGYGLYENATKADKFSKKVAEDIEKALKEGKLKKDKRIHITSQMRGIDIDDITKALDRQYTWFNELSEYNKCEVFNYRSTGEYKDVIKMQTFTSTNVVYENYNNQYDIVDKTNNITSIYKTFGSIVKILSILAFAFMTIKTIIDLIKKRYSDLDLYIIILGIALSVLLVLTEVALFMDYLSPEVIDGFRDFYCASAFPLIQLFKYLPILYVIGLMNKKRKELSKMKVKKNSLKEAIKVICSLNIKKMFKEKTDNTFIQFFRYLFVGGIAAVVNIGMLYVFTDICNLHYLISNILSFILGLTVNYILSKKFVFQEETTISRQKEFIIYAIIGIIGLGIDTGLMWIFTDLVVIYYMISKLISTAIVFVWNFGARKMLYKIIK